VASNIESIEIFPGENGGHRVVHNLKRELNKKEGLMGGLYMGWVGQLIGRASRRPLGGNRSDTLGPCLSL
jgi:hypothetical protein